MSERGRKRRAQLPKINRSDTSRKVVMEAAKMLQDIRGKAQYLIPFRLIHHLPNHGMIIRPVDTVRATFIGTGIGTSGFRRHEPCCTSDPMPEIGLRRYVIGGNHRAASTRDSGQVLVPTNRISSKHVRRLMRLLKEEDEELVATGFMEKHHDDQQQAFRCLEILAVTLQGLEPAPKPLTCLQQVQVIRTSARNDLTLDLSSRSTASYGGVMGLRERIFPNHPGTDDSSVHFLLNNKIGPRHKNKLLAGARALIFNNNSFAVPELGESISLLDVLIQWEAKGYMGTFLDTHLSYVGPMSTSTLHAIMENAYQCIQAKNYAITPFDTSAFRKHVTRSAPVKRLKAARTGASAQPKTHNLRKSAAKNIAGDASPAPKKGKLRAAVSVELSQKGRKSGRGREDVQVNLRDDDHSEVGEEPNDQSQASEESDVQALSPAPSETKTMSEPVEDVNVKENASKAHPKPKTRSESLTDGTNAACESNTAKELSTSTGNNASDGGNPLGSEKLQQFSKEKEIEALQKSLEEERKKSAEISRSASEQNAVLKRQHENEIQLAVKKAKLHAVDPSVELTETIKKLEKQLNETRCEKEKEIASVRAFFESKQRKEQEKSANDYEEENERLRQRLADMEKEKSSGVQALQDIKAIRDENAAMKIELEELRSSLNQGRRLGRPTIPTEKMIASMSAQARRELKRRLERFEQE